MDLHHYHTTLNWNGNRGTGTSSYKSYGRSYTVSIKGKPELQGSADPQFRGSPAKWNPEELFLASLSACHMLWYLHLCAEGNVRVLSYVDNAVGEMEIAENGSGRFTSVTLHPKVTISEGSSTEKAIKLHRPANGKCFIANSCNFPVNHKPTLQAI